MPRTVRLALRPERARQRNRVKSYPQIVSTLRDLPFEHTRGARALEMFQESRERVRSMIHERLDRSGDLARVNFGGGHIQRLTRSPYRTYKMSDDDVRLEVEASAPPLTIDTAVPCGLLSNGPERAFAGTGRGTIRAPLFRAGAGTNVPRVGGDGFGLPPGIGVRNTGSFELQLVNGLAEQLGGTLEVSTGRGPTVFTARFTEL